MRFAGNFHPEGYLAPTPNFMRTARMVVVATAIGATAGAAVVLSLVDRPAPGPMADTSKTMVVVHALVQPAEAAVPATPAAEPVAAAMPAPVTPAVPAAMQASVPPPVQASAPAAPPPTAPAPQVTAKISAPAPSEAPAIATPAAPATVAALAESPPATENVMPATDMVTADPAAPKAALLPAAKKLPATAGAALPGQQQAQHGPVPGAAPAKKKTAGNDGLAPILRRLFSAN